MAADTICSDFETQENKVCHCFLCFPIYLPRSDGTRCHDLSFLILLLCIFPCGSADKESTCNVGDLGSIPGLGRSPGEGKGYPLQNPDLEKSMACIGHGVAKSWTWLSDFHFEGKVWFLARCWEREKSSLQLGEKFSQWLGYWCGEGDGTPLQYSCLENPKECIFHGVSCLELKLSR